MDIKRLAILGALIVFLVILIVVFFRSGVKEEIRPSLEVPSAESEPAPAQPKMTRKVTLFFIDEDDTLLRREERVIADDSSVVRLAKKTIEELIKGSEKGYVSPFPPETKLRELFISQEGVAYVDFSEDIVQRHLSGSSAEISTIYSLVNTLAYNFKPIKKVFILIEGQERETLGGHINLSQPFLPQYDLIAD